jgi:predicted amidohydrolase YtcJ
VYPYVQGLQHCQQAVQNMRRYEGPLVRAQGIKLAIDGYALMYDPPAQHKHLDMPMHPQPIFNEMITAIHKAGWQADVHAVGDRGVDWTLEAFARAAGSAAECRRRRHRIEHFPFRKADTIKRAAELDAPVCQQPLYVDIKADDFAQKLGPRGPGLVATMCPMRTFAREGVHVAYGADVPAFPSHNPLDSLRCAVERITRAGKSLDASEALSTPEAIHAHTMGSAYASFDEKELGSLEQGKLADFVIWDRDVRQARTGRQVMALKALATFVGGKAVHTAAGAPA